MSKFQIKSATPESKGLSSKTALDFLKTLDEYGLYTHSIMFARGDEVIAEAYYKPFNKDSLHRMYSVSKSFVSVAIGLALTEKLITLDDKIIDYFPEYVNENFDEYYSRCTIKDMLKMKSNIGTNVYWWGKFDTRTRAYYSQKTVKSPNSIFYYDSIGSFLLGNVIKKLTGKDFLEYLKEKVLLELGFSKESYVLTEPGGYAVGDSAVMCTLRDLFIFTRLIAKKGYVNGKQYIDKDFMLSAIKVQSQNDLYADFNNFKSFGYGYLIWIIKEGFALFGAGDQYAFCDLKNDFTFVINSDNQGTTYPQHLIYHEFANTLIKNLNKKPLEEDKTAYEKLIKYQKSRKLVVQRGKKYSNIINLINGVTYKSVMDNDLNISQFRVDFNKDSGKFTFIKDGKENSIEFYLGKNKLVNFSFGTRPKADMMGVDVCGTYSCATSGAFIDENTLAIKVQVIDTYFGKLQITLHFNNNEANLYMHKCGQYVFDGIGGYVLAKS